MHTGYSQPFGASESLPRCFFAVFPCITGTSIEENGNNEEVDSSLGFLLIVYVCPFGDHRIDTVYTCVKMSPSAVRRNLHGRVGRGEHQLVVCKSTHARKVCPIVSLATFNSLRNITIRSKAHRDDIYTITGNLCFILWVIVEIL